MQERTRNVETFNESEDWLQYVKRLEHYFEANGIADNDKKGTILLTVCGPKIYKLIRDLVSPVKPKEKTFD